VKPRKRTCPIPAARDEPSEVLLDTVLPYLVNRVSHHMTRALARDLAERGLTISHWRVLAVLDARRAGTIGELAGYAMIEQSTLSRLVARMVRAGLVARRRGTNDARLTEVALTAEGARTFAQIRPLALAHADRALAGLSDRDIATFRNVARRILGNIETAGKERGAGDMPAPR